MSESSVKPSNLLVAVLQLQTASNYGENLNILIEHITLSNATLIVAPELCLTNFDYEHFEEASEFYFVAIEKLLTLISDKILVLTLIKKENKDFFNQAVVIHQHKILHRQNKYKLFKLGREENYFKAGKKSDILPFTLNGIRYAILICFELRFKTLWKEVEDVDVVIIPARWGGLRKIHLEVLSRALAIMNQTFVLVSNSGDSDMAKSSAILSPWGEVFLDDSLDKIESKIDFRELKKVRRLINMKEA